MAEGRTETPRESRSPLGARTTATDGSHLPGDVRASSGAEQGPKTTHLGPPSATTAATAPLTFWCSNCALIWDEPFCAQCGAEHLSLNNDRPPRPPIPGKTSAARRSTV